jgi:hypothetical protein
MGEKPTVPAEQAAPKNEELRTPHAHAVAIGAFRDRKLAPGAVVATIGGGAPSLGEYSMQHAAAEALHGWKEHAHHEGKPIEISVDDYKRALLAAWKPVTRPVLKDGKLGDPIDSHEAAEKGIATVTDYEPHKPALSKHAAHVKAAKAATKAAAEAKG